MPVLIIYWAISIQYRYLHLIFHLGMCQSIIIKYKLHFSHVNHFSLIFLNKKNFFFTFAPTVYIFHLCIYIFLFLLMEALTTIYPNNSISKEDNITEMTIVLKNIGGST